MSNPYCISKRYEAGLNSTRVVEGGDGSEGSLSPFDLGDRDRFD